MARTQKKEERVRSSLHRVIIALSTIFWITACGNNSKSGRPNTQSYPVNYYNGNYGGALCPTCGMNLPWTIFAGTDSSSASGSVSLGLDFYGDPSTGSNFYDPAVPLKYSGPVVVRGQLTVTIQDSLICNAPPGQYQLVSLSAGQWQSGVMSGGYSGYGPTGLRMEARSNMGVSLILSLPKAVIYNPTGTTSWYPNRLGGTLVFESINGMPCRTNAGLTAYTELY